MNIKKREITKRLQLLNDGRAHYLEFLRNLTPQTLLLSIVWLLAAKLDFTKFDINNWFPTALFFFLFGWFALAVYASSTLFYQRCFADLIKWRSTLFKSLTFQGLTGHRRFFAKVDAVWKERFIEVLELQAVFWLFQVALGIEILRSLFLASTMWKGIH
jgi:hypothetical protein